MRIQIEVKTLVASPRMGVDIVTLNEGNPATSPAQADYSQASVRPINQALPDEMTAWTFSETPSTTPSRGADTSGKTGSLVLIDGKLSVQCPNV
ncbi:hypothetical protein [Spirosoma fluviale]|uniref:hypothetical protein n=1 Tax=Spirosoma fluviale TaxID=1597977 RepID=UPI0011817CBB|nr:hypothetical protein [Spirosoma fluviale]